MARSEDSNASGSDEEPEYEVERILAESVANGQTIYLVKWQNYDDNQCTWEPAENFLTPVTLADWQRQLAENDTLDEDEVARVQARMDAFVLAQEEADLEKSRKTTQSTLKRQRESLPIHNQPTVKRARASPTTPKQLGSDANTKSKKGIAHVVRPNQASSTSANSKRMTGSPPRPSSVIRKMAVTTTSIPKSIPRPRDIGQPPKQRPHDVAAPSRPSIPKADKTSNKTDVNKPSKAMPKASHTKDMTGQRFRNLSHQNNFVKKARQEPAPEMSKLDLRSPDDWASRPAPGPQEAPRRPSDRGSPLFVPEEGTDHQFDLETTSPVMESPTSLTALSTAAESKAGDELASTTTSELYNLSATGHGSPPVDDTLHLPARAPALDNRQDEMPPTDNITELINTTPPTIPGNRATEKQSSITRTMSHPSQISTGTRNVHADRLSTIVQAESESANSIGPTAPSKSTVGRQVSETYDRRTPSTSHVARWRDSLPDQHPAEQPRFQQINPLYPPASEKVLTAANGRSYRKGEVIVCLTFGDHAVGDVKFVHLPLWTSRRIIDLKEPSARSLQIHFQQNLVVDPTNFSILFRNFDIRQQGIGAIEAYDDTLKAYESLLQYLEGNNLGAIWEHPDPGDSFVMVLYSPRAPGWQYLDYPPLPNTASPLHVAILNKLPGIVLDIPSTRHHQPILSQTAVETPPTRSTITRPELRVSTLEPAAVTMHSPIELSAQVSARSMIRDPAVVSQTPKSPGRRDSISFSERMEWTPSSPPIDSTKPFSANFDAMVIGLDKQKKPRVFIAFAASHPTEATTVKDWLSQYLGPRWIFSDDQDNDWSDFRGEVNSQPGLILFHEAYPSYCDIPHLYKYLRPASLWCYSVSFNRHGNPLTRLFPRGTALCITEDTLTNHAEGALLALKWFEENSMGKAQSWKLVVPPGFPSYILPQLDANNDDGRQRYISMLEIWYKLRDRLFEASSNKKSHLEDPEKFIKATSAVEDDQLVISPTGVADYIDWDHAGLHHDAVSTRDAALLNFFVGWSMKNITKHRLFVVVDTAHTNKTEKQVCHIWFREPASFGRQEK